MVLSNWLRGITRAPSLRRRSRQRRKTSWTAQSESLEDKVLLTQDGIYRVLVAHDHAPQPDDPSLSLRYALDHASENPDIHTIQLKLDNHSVIELAEPLIIDQDIRIEPYLEGRSISLTVASSNESHDSDPNQHIFRVMPGSDVTLENIALHGGDVVSDNGGAIWNAGDLTLNRVTVSGSSTPGAGGGVYNSPAGSLEINSSTFSGNTASSGGAIHNDGVLTLTDSTIAENSSGLSAGQGQIVVSNSIVAQNTAYDVSGNIQSDGYNLIGNADGSFAFNQTGDQTGTGTVPLDPLFGDFQENGGAGWTYQLLPGSPAIDAGNSSAEFDQRGAPRTIDGPDPGDRTDAVATPDIGAFEFGAFFVNTGADAVDSTEFADGLVDASPTEAGHQVTLRAAVQELNALAGYSEDPYIEPDVLEGYIIYRNQTYSRLTIDGSGENHAATGDLDVFGNLTIQGQATYQSFAGEGDTPGEGLTPTTGVLGDVAVEATPDHIDGRSFNDRIFHVLPEAQFHVDRMQIDGGLSLEDGSPDGGHGGAILNDGGDLSLLEATIGNLNVLVLGGSGSYAQRKGGAIYTRDGNVTVTSSYVGMNLSRMGGAVFVESGDVLIESESDFWRNEAAVRGGTFYLNEGSLHLTDETLVGETKAGARLEGGPGFEEVRGGAIYNYYGDLLIDGGSLISHSRSQGGSGGAIYNAGRTQIVDTTIEHALALSGGGIFNNGSLLVIQDSRFETNTAERGGAVLNTSHRTVEIHDSEFIENGSFRGGAVYNNNGTVNVHDSLFRKNTVQGALLVFTEVFHGGAIYNTNIDGELNVVGSTFDNNFAFTSGGGIYSRNAETNIQSSTFFDNTAFGLTETAGAAPASRSRITCSRSVGDTQSGQFGRPQ